MEAYPIKNDARQARRKRRIGTPAICVVCGLRQLEALILVPRGLIERHHVAGKANDARLTIPICRNCHATLTERARRAGVSMRPPASLLERLVAVLKGLGVFFRELAAACVRWATELSRFVHALDTACPGWRQVEVTR